MSKNRFRNAGCFGAEPMKNPAVPLSGGVRREEKRKGKNQPMVLKRMLALTMAMARMEETSISMGAWCGL